jgi:hypothetical protein
VCDLVCIYCCILVILLASTWLPILSFMYISLQHTYCSIPNQNIIHQHPNQVSMPRKSYNRGVRGKRPEPTPTYGLQEYQCGTQSARKLIGSAR